MYSTSLFQTVLYINILHITCLNWTVNHCTPYKFLDCAAYKCTPYQDCTVNNCTQYNLFTVYFKAMYSISHAYTVLYNNALYIIVFKSMTCLGCTPSLVVYSNVYWSLENPCQLVEGVHLGSIQQEVGGEQED